MVTRYLILIACIIAVVLVASEMASRSEAAHEVYLPYVPNTPLMQQVIKHQEYNWCADARASAYPNFLSQLRDVNEQYAKRTGIKSKEVAFSDTSCMVRHTMPDSFPCGASAAACIYYGNWPVTIYYKYTLGYVDWRSAHGHELGHGLLGLHEQYDDLSGIGCTRRTDTVMDCGSGVRYPTPLDVSRACAIISTSWCGTDATQSCEPFTNPGDGMTWKPCIGRWFTPSGEHSVDPSTWRWYRETGTKSILIFDPCNPDGIRWFHPSGIFLPPGSEAFDPEHGYWERSLPC